MEQEFQYYQFTDFEGTLICRPVNPHKMHITQFGRKWANQEYVMFEKFASDNTHQVWSECQPGLYEKNDVLLVEKHGGLVYVLN